MYGIESDKGYVKTGGLGTLLFLIYINDLETQHLNLIHFVFNINSIPKANRLFLRVDSRIFVVGYQQTNFL